MVYPAAVTPFDEKGRVDFIGLAKLLAWFEAAGCQGAVLAGTNGEGPSLSAVEKRDLVVEGVKLAGGLEVVLGVSTPSTHEAVWLCKQAHQAGASSVLLMAPGYFREATEAGVEAWFRFVLDGSPLPVIIYNFPKRTGFTISPELLGRLCIHDRFAGVKDSSGEATNLTTYRQAVEHPLFVGDETLLANALDAGWTGTISGAANVVPEWLVDVCRDRDAKFDLLLPVLQAIRSSPQPATHKALLCRWGVLPRPDVRLPLLAAEMTTVTALEDTIRTSLG